MDMNGMNFLLFALYLFRLLPRMEFTDVFPQTLRSCCAFSPNGQFVAVCDTFRAVVRDSKTLETLTTFSCADKIEYMCFSPDSTMLLCALYKRRIVQIWHLEFGEWRCKIDEGSAGVCAVRWSPDSRHVLTTADFSIRMTVWSLSQCTVAYIKQPKQCKEPLDFTQNGLYLAVVERNNAIGIFDCSDAWKLTSHFNTDATDVVGVKWSPDCRHLVVLDCSINYTALIYSSNGKLLTGVSSQTPTLGIKSADWSPTGQFLALGSYDGKVRLVCQDAWFVVKEFLHDATVDWRECAVFREYYTKPSDILGVDKSKVRRGVNVTTKHVPRKKDEYGLPILHDDNELREWKEQTLTTQTKYEFVETSHSNHIQLQMEELDLDKINPAIGIGLCSFSGCGRYLATINDRMPSVVWIWDIAKLSLFSVLVHKKPVLCARWDPWRPRLAIATAFDGRFYLWSRGGALVAAIPVTKGTPPFACRSLQWSPDGSSLLAAGRDSFCVCFVTDPSA